MRYVDQPAPGPDRRVARRGGCGRCGSWPRGVPRWARRSCSSSPGTCRRWPTRSRGRSWSRSRTPGRHELRLTDRGPVEIHHEVGFIDAMTSSEVSLATGLGQWAAGRKVGLAEALAGRFPKLLGKVIAGELATVNAGKVVTACDGLDDQPPAPRSRTSWWTGWSGWTRPGSPPSPARSPPGSPPTRSPPPPPRTRRTGPCRSAPARTAPPTGGPATRRALRRRLGRRP